MPADLISPLLPPEVRVAQARELVAADAVDDVLRGPERAAIRQAVAARRQEYATGRVCAHRALAQLGHPDAPVPSRADRSPAWPAGVVGSITHCAGLVAAAVAPAGSVRSIGIDAEPNQPLPPGVAELTLDERDRVVPGAGLHADRLIFSAKESVYKAWWPITHRWLGFHDVTLAAADGRFTATVLITDDGEPATLAGRYGWDADHIVTTVIIGE